MKFRRSPDDYGWTDQAYKRQWQWIIGNVTKKHPLKHKCLIRNKRPISKFSKNYQQQFEQDIPF
jgi:hypothetical protein